MQSTKMSVLVATITTDLNPEQAAWEAWRITRVSASSRVHVHASSCTFITSSFVILMHLDSCVTLSCLFSPTRCCFRSQSWTKYSVRWRLLSELERICLQFFTLYMTWNDLWEGYTCVRSMVCSFSILNRLIPVYVKDYIYPLTRCMTSTHSVEQLFQYLSPLHVPSQFRLVFLRDPSFLANAQGIGLPSCPAVDCSQWATFCHIPHCQPSAWIPCRQLSS